MSEEMIWSGDDSLPDEKEQCAGIKPKASVLFTLHVHLDDGTTKDIHCIGRVLPYQPTKE